MSSSVATGHGAGGAATPPGSGLDVGARVALVEDVALWPAGALGTVVRPSGPGLGLLEVLVELDSGGRFYFDERALNVLARWPWGANDAVPSESVGQEPRRIQLARSAIAIVMRQNDTDADSAAAQIRSEAERRQVPIMEIVEVIVLLTKISSTP